MVFGSTAASDTSMSIVGSSSGLGCCSGSFVGGGSALSSPVCSKTAGVFAPAVIAAKERGPVGWSEGRAGPALRGQVLASWPAWRHIKQDRS